MTSTAQKILDDALALPEDERRRVAKRILDTIPHESTSESDVERAWDEEVLRRVKASEREVEARDWGEASAELRAKYASIQK